uniref:sushi, von Willebrand factor type A, EGF and pentraxin domain-containing protein 1-like n=1 Tax=Pristiophorus japonicus TaxID=55135 RepID=UPI00398ECC84
MVAGFQYTYRYRDTISYRCNPGYEMVGNDVIECSETSTFVPPPPMCKPREYTSLKLNGSKGSVECHLPELPTNGQILSGFGPTYRRWQKITYSCNEGYEMVGSSVIECSENNAFVPPPPTCRPRTCGKPPQLEYGSPMRTFISRTPFNVGSRVIYNCNRGYKFMEGGSRIITCTKDSTWTQLRATCKLRHCGNPGEILDGYSYAPHDTFGSQVIFYCDRGYRIVGKDYRVCTANGWDGQIPTCRLEEEDKIQAMQRKRTRNQEDELIGFNISLKKRGGSINSPILNDGRAQHVTAKDKVETSATSFSQKCRVDDPSRPPHELPTITEASLQPIRFTPRDIKKRLSAKAIGPDNILAVMLKTCAPELAAPLAKLFQYSYNTAIHLIMWKIAQKDKGSSCMGTPPPPSSPPNPVTCADPPPISKGIAPSLSNGDHWQYGMVAKYACLGDNSLIGAEKLVCTENGEWDKDPPTCKAVICADLPPIRNGKTPTPPYAENWEYGMVARYSCIGDYSLIGADELVCTATGQWDKDPPACKAAVNCGNPREISNGYYETSGTTVGSKTTFYCDKGYQIVGRDFQLCTADGWDGQVPTCESVNCGYPREIPNGYYETSGTTVGSKTTFYCDKGYQIVGRDFQLCTADGWDSQVPACESVNCGYPRQIPNGYYETSGTTVGSKTTFYCEKGYQIVGRDFQLCTADGWDGQVPTCESVNCGNPREIPNGYYETSGTTVGSKTIFYCDKGYQIVGRDFQLCTADGWDGQVPTCEFVGCHHPELPANSRIVAGFGPTYKHREMITYSCNEGYEMVGNSVIECTENNTFVPSPPICKQCG